MQENKTFRLFISSTFDDFRAERKVLQEDVFPIIKGYCSGEGLTFQPIDLRWGVSNEAQLDQKALELCLNEVRSCKLHAAPNFLLMLGDRYGWVPLPYHIEKEEFETLLELVSDEEKSKLYQWYKLDKNQLEFDSNRKLKSDGSYVLQERTGDYKAYENWEEAEIELRDILQTAVKNSKLYKEQRTKYFQSATEAEIIEGVFPYLDPTSFQEKLLEEQPGLVDTDQNNVFGFFRSGGEEYEKTNAFKERVKGALANTQTKNILTLETQQTTESTLGTAYLDEFKTKVTEFLKERINAQLAQNQPISKLKQEIQAHQDYANQKTRNFIGQKSILKDIKAYCDGSSQKPLLIHGSSGRGKSAIMAKAYQQAQSNALVRFVGAIPDSGDMKSILYSIFDQLDIEPRTPGGDSDKETYDQFSDRMHDQIMQLERLGKNIIIFIDAVDQLNHKDQFDWLPETLPRNVKIILSALEDDNYADDLDYFDNLKNKTNQTIEVGAFKVEEGKELIETLLERENRKLQPHQMDYVLKQYQPSKTPLYITLAAQEVKHWKSYDCVADTSIENQPKERVGVKPQDLQDTQQGIIKEFIQNLTRFYHHDSRLVERVLAYIYLSEQGLSEYELLDFLNQDKKFVNEIATDEHHEKETDGLPVAIWARLYQMLKPFLSQKTVDGENLIYIYHREFEVAVAEFAERKAFYEAMIDANIDIAQKIQSQPFTNSRFGKILGIILSKYELNFEGQDLECGILPQYYDLLILKVGNDQWIFDFLEDLSDKALQLYRSNRHHFKTYKPTSLKSARAKFQVAVNVSKSLYKSNEAYWTLYYIQCLNHLGQSLDELKNYDEAKKYYEIAIAIILIPLEESPKTFRELYYGLMNNLNLSKKKSDEIGQKESAEMGNLQLLHQLKQNHSEKTEVSADERSMLSTILNNTAASLVDKDTSQAILYFKEALAIRKRLFEEESPEPYAEKYIISLNNLAYCLYTDKKYVLAKKYYGTLISTLEQGLLDEDFNRWSIFYNTALDNWRECCDNEGRIEAWSELADKYEREKN